MLEIINVSKNFPEAGNHQVLRDINMSIQDGEFVCILGPSGCGKSVFLYILAGFLESSSGQIVINGNVAREPNTERTLIFQDYSLFPWRTAYGNIIFGLEKKNFSKQQKEDLTDKYLDMVGLTQFKDWFPCNLSGGMKQRVALARALITDPEILLMDEPFAALDPEYRKYMRKNLEQIWQKTKKTVVLVTHSVNEAIGLADTIYLFSNLPASIKKKYTIDLPRPRDAHSSEFINIAREIESEIEKEFKKSLDENPMPEIAIRKILNNA